MVRQPSFPSCQHCTCGNFSKGLLFKAWNITLQQILKLIPRLLLLSLCRSNSKHHPAYSRLTVYLPDPWIWNQTWPYMCSPIFSLTILAIECIISSSPLGFRKFACLVWMHCAPQWLVVWQCIEYKVLIRVRQCSCLPSWEDFAFCFRFVWSRKLLLHGTIWDKVVPFSCTSTM